MERFLLEHLSTPVLAVCVVAVIVGMSLLGLALVRRSVQLSTLESHKDVAGFIFAVVGVLYAVLLAFVVIIVWEQFDTAASNADQEAVAVGNLYRIGLALDRPGAQLRTALRGYATSVADVEWNRMDRRPYESRATDLALNRVWRAAKAVQPRNSAQTAFLTQAITDLDRATQLRRSRLLSSTAVLPGPLWIALIVGAIITIGFTYFFGLERFAAQILMVTALSAMIGVTLFVVVALDLPYTGSVAVKPEAMRQAIVEFAHS